jgi:hypothetical protein
MSETLQHLSLGIGVLGVVEEEDGVTCVVIIF